MYLVDGSDNFAAVVNGQHRVVVGPGALRRTGFRPNRAGQEHLPFRHHGAYCRKCIRTVGEKEGHRGLGPYDQPGRGTAGGGGRGAEAHQGREDVFLFMGIPFFGS